MRAGSWQLAVAQCRLPVLQLPVCPTGGEPVGQTRAGFARLEGAEDSLSPTPDWRPPPKPVGKIRSIQLLVPTRGAIRTHKRKCTQANTHSLLALKREIITREWHKSERPALAAAAPPSTPIVGRRAQALYEPAKQAAVNGLSSSVWRPPSNPERKRGVGRKLPANVP